jgi:hypothetical protein
MKTKTQSIAKQQDPDGTRDLSRCMESEEAKRALSERPTLETLMPELQLKDIEQKVEAMSADERRRVAMVNLIPAPRRSRGTNSMYYISILKTIKPEAEQMCFIDNKVAQVTWKGDTLTVDTDHHHVLHSHINGDSRVFTCASPPQETETPECEHCEDPDKNGVYPAELGLHRIKHVVEGSATCIPCRKGNANTTIGWYSWTDNYRKAAPATQML